MMIKTLSLKAKAGRTLEAASTIAIKAHRSKARHQRIVRQYRRDHPLCQRCTSAATEEVHHIDRVEHGGATEPHNLLSLCKPCHLTIDELTPAQQRALKEADELSSGNVASATPIGAIKNAVFGG